jgi:crotonobetainyl-CoA:carnitine CoA-transferase CaiB-like acyl-CoA transferase
MEIGPASEGPFRRGPLTLSKAGSFCISIPTSGACTLDLRHDRETLARLVAWADLLVHNYPPAEMAALGIDYPTFRAINPRLVMCSITPFGLTGPHKDYHAYELTVAHGGGWAWLSPGGSDHPELPPLKAAGQQADFQGGLAAATAALAAYLRALRTGEGEHLDLSSQAYIASFLELNIIYYTYQGQVASRLGKRLLYPWGIFECQDGLMFLVVAEEDQWQRLLALMGNPEWSTWEIFQGVMNRTKNQDVLRMYLTEWMREWKVEDLFRAGQEQRICFAPVLSMSHLARQEQLHARHFFVDVTHPRAGTLKHLGAPYQLHDPWWKIRRAAPLRGEHNQEVIQLASEVSSYKFQVSSPKSSTPSCP